MLLKVVVQQFYIEHGNNVSEEQIFVKNNKNFQKVKLFLHEQI